MTSITVCLISSLRLQCQCPCNCHFHWHCLFIVLALWGCFLNCLVIVDLIISWFVRSCLLIILINYCVLISNSQSGVKHENQEVWWLASILLEQRQVIIFDKFTYVQSTLTRWKSLKLKSAKKSQIWTTGVCGAFSPWTSSTHWARKSWGPFARKHVAYLCP